MTERVHAVRCLAGSLVPVAVLLPLVWGWHRVQPDFGLPWPGPMSWYAYVAVTLAYLGV